MSGDFWLDVWIIAWLNLIAVLLDAIDDFYRETEGRNILALFDIFKPPRS